MSSTSPRLSLDTTSPLSPAGSVRSYFPYTPDSTGRATRSRRSSIASINSIGGSLDIPSRRGSTVRETSQNAISTLLSAPIVRTGLLPHSASSSAASGYRAPTTRDIPPVTLSKIPQVPSDAFKDYIERLGRLFDTIQRGRQDDSDTKEKEGGDGVPQTPDRRFSTDFAQSPISSRPSIVSRLSIAESRPGYGRRRSSAQHRRNRNEPTPLSTIPSVYFEEDFHLENPRTFDIVSERAEIVKPPSGASSAEATENGAPRRKALATNAIIQEKLSWYMDTVEVHLINNISTASTGFFAALGSLKQLQTEAAESVERIQALRSDLKQLDENVALGGLEVANKRRRKRNLAKLGQAAAQIQRVVDNVIVADDLVDKEEFNRAADQLERTGRLLCGIAEDGEDAQELIDLRPLKALQALDPGLRELQMRIGAGFASGFIKTLLDDLKQHVAKIQTTDTLKRLSRQRGIPPVYMETGPELRRNLEAALMGLARSGHTAAATAGYREAVQKEIKNIIRAHLPSSSDDDTESMMSMSFRGGQAHRSSQQERSLTLARNLRALDPKDAEALLINIYTQVSEALRRISTQTKILLDVTSTMHTPEPLQQGNHTQVADAGGNRAGRPNGNLEFHQALDMSSLLEQAVDTAQVQISRVIKVRNEQTIRLSPPMFLRYFALNRIFTDECEAVSGRGGQALKNNVNAQISGFVQVLGVSMTESIAAILDSESWSIEELTSESESILKRIISSMTSDPPEWNQSKPIWEHETTTTNPPAIEESAAAPGKSSSKTAVIDDNRFYLVHAAASLLPSIERCLSLTTALPSMTPQISASLLDVLRSFNSRSCQLVLGAGATKSAGLKNITTKHLALASQALSFVIALVPYMRECVRRHLQAGQTNVLAEFDKTKRLFQDHQSGIHDKLVDIMTSRSQAHVKAMSAIDFDTQADDGKVSPYMETLTKETGTLHRVLSRHLSEVDTEMIMRQIAFAYKEQWTRAFSEVDTKTESGVKHLLIDAEAFESRLGRIEGFAQVAKEVLAVVKAGIDADDQPEKDKSQDQKPQTNEAPNDAAKESANAEPSTT